MYFVMKSFWKLATRGGRLSPAHSTTLLVSLLPAASATRTEIDEVGSSAGLASSPRRATSARWYMYRLLAASPSTILLPPIPASPPSGLMLLLLRLIELRNTPSAPANDIDIAGPDVSLCALLCAST